MTEQEQATAITELIEMQERAMSMTVLHENEAARYRKQYHNIGKAIVAIGETKTSGKKK